MHNKVKHSKIRNTGLLFEFLLRQITTDVLNKKNNSSALKLIKQKFNERCELGKELALYNALLSKKFSNDKKAEYFINEVLKERANLIKEMKEGYNLPQLLSTKVNYYKAYASIYKLFEFVDLSPQDKTESFFNLVEHVTTKENTIKLSESFGGTQIPNNPELRILTYRTLLEKFNQKYTRLNQKQKGLLREYINNVSNSNSLKSTLVEIVNELKDDLKKNQHRLQDKVVKIKLKEAINSIEKFCGLKNKSQFVKDADVLQTMRYIELVKELKKSDKKTIKK